MIEKSPVVSKSAKIAVTAVIGKPYRPLTSGTPISYSDTIISDNVYVGDFVVIGRGASIGKKTIVDDYSKIEANSRIGARCLIQYGAYICAETQIGDECVIGGFITERTVIGSKCRIFGSIVHEHKDTRLPWDDDRARERSASISENVFVGFGAQVIGAIVVGANAYIAAGAIVTEDVPPNTRVLGINKHQRSCMSGESGI